MHASDAAFRSKLNPLVVKKKKKSNSSFKLYILLLSSKQKPVALFVSHYCALFQCLHFQDTHIIRTRGQIVKNLVTKRWYIFPWKITPFTSHGFPFRLSYYFFFLSFCLYRNFTHSPTLWLPPTSTHQIDMQPKAASESQYFHQLHVSLHVTSVGLLLSVGSSRARDQFLSQIGNILC